MPAMVKERARASTNVCFDRSLPRSSVGTQPRTLRRPVEAKRMRMITLLLPTAHMEPFRDRVNGATPRPG